MGHSCSCRCYPSLLCVVHRMVHTSYGMSVASCACCMLHVVCCNLYGTLVCSSAEIAVAHWPYCAVPCRAAQCGAGSRARERREHRCSQHRGRVGGGLAYIARHLKIRKRSVLARTAVAIAATWNARYSNSCTQWHTAAHFSRSDNQSFSDGRCCMIVPSRQEPLRSSHPVFPFTAGARTRLWSTPAVRFRAKRCSGGAAGAAGTI